MPNTFQRLCRALEAELQVLVLPNRDAGWEQVAASWGLAAASSGVAGGFAKGIV